MGRYCKNDAVKVRLENKVKFAAPGDTDPNKMSPSLFASLVNEAETQLEIDLMMRYEVPFQDRDAGTFVALPNSTQTTIALLAEVLSVIRILETDFGRGTSANSDKYTEKLQKRYDALVLQLMEIKKETYQTWLRPPLAGLKSSYQNQGDSGFRGMVHNTTTITAEADYATKQINSPGENIFNGVIDPLDIGTVRGG